MNKLLRFFIAGFLALGLALPSPAHALRPHSDLAGLEEELSVRPEFVEGRDSRAGLEEVVEPPSGTYSTWLFWWNPQPVYWAVFPDVYSPDDTEGNSGTYQMVLALKAMQREGSLSLNGIRTLDMGVGSGPLSGYLLSEGARETVGIDVNPEAIPNTAHNLRRHLPDRKGNFRGYVGDLWDALPETESELFDLAVFNPPPFSGNPQGLEGAQLFGGADFSVLKRFVRGLPQRLSPVGKALLRVHRFDDPNTSMGIPRFGPGALQELISSESIPLEVKWVEERGEFVVAVLTHQPVPLAGLEEEPRHLVAVIGAGPSGIGAAQSLVALGNEVGLFDEKELYGGLAVYGVYPNKEDPMKLAYRFKSLGPTVVMPGVHFYGGVRVGKDGDLTLDDLRRLGYSAIVVAIGAEGSKPLRIPGERPGLPGLYQAKDLVAFYQGDPAASGLDPRLGAISILIGIGNVTVDTTHYAIHRRDYQAVHRFVQSLTREEQKKLLQSLKQRLPDEGQFRRNLGFYRPGVGRTVDVDELREVLHRADLGEFQERLEQAWESTADIPSTHEVYWVARRGPEQKAFEPKEVEVLAPYIDLEDLRAELRRVAPELGWDPADEGAMEQHLYDLLFKHPKIGRIDGKPAEKLKRFGTRLDKARIRMRFLLRGHSIEGDHADGIVFARNRMAGGRMEETNELADKQQLFGKEPVDSVVLSIGNEHDEDFGIQTRKGLFETRADRLVGEGPSPLSHYFEAADAEGLILTGWARTPSTGKVGEAMSDGRNTVQIAVAPYLSERSDLRKDARALAVQRADLNRILAERGIQAVSGGQAAALHAWFIQNGYQPNDRTEILGIARDLEERKVTAELLSEARLPEGARIFAQKNAIPRATQKLFAEQGIEVVELPEDLEQARALLEAAGDLSNAAAWLSSSVEWFERDEWNGLFAGLGVRAVQLVGVMPHSVDRWSLAHWAALFGAFPKAGLQVILSVEEQDRILSIYV